MVSSLITKLAQLAKPIVPLVLQLLTAQNALQCTSLMVQIALLAQEDVLNAQVPLLALLVLQIT